MRAAAILQSAIDITDAIIMAARDNGAPADRIIAGYFKQRRYMGSGDRRKIRALVWRAIRAFGDPPPNGRAAFATLADNDPELAALFDGSQYAPTPLTADEPRAPTGTIPQWLNGRWMTGIDATEQEALLGRADLDMRFDPQKTGRDAIKAQWPEAQFSDDLPYAVRLDNGIDISTSALWQNGAIEVQDWGSQAIIHMALSGYDTGKPLKIIDLCAGAGGKTLALAAMCPDAEILAFDTNRKRLQAMTPRVERAGYTHITPILLNGGREWDSLKAHMDSADLVLVDAPCSGTGTWRRNPETRWRFDQSKLMQLLDLQAHIIDMAKMLVKPDGHLAYAVCSLLYEESAAHMANGFDNRDGWHMDCPDMPIGRSISAPKMAKEMATHMAETVPNRTKNDNQVAQNAILGKYVTPAHDDMDGFFMSWAKKNGQHTGI